MGDREAIRNKLREKLNGKRIQRSSNDTKEKILDSKLKKFGVDGEDAENFKKKIKGLNPDMLKKYLADKVEEVKNAL